MSQNLLKILDMEESQKEQEKLPLLKMKTRIGSAIFSSSIKESQGKKDAAGIFSATWAWGYPANRSWSIIMTLYDVNPGLSTQINIEISSNHSETPFTIKTIKLDSLTKENTVIYSRLNYSFPGPGEYEVACRLSDNDNIFTLPMLVKTREWPEFTNEEIEIARNNQQQITYELSIKIDCSYCNKSYKFIENIFKEKLPRGSFSFPESGIFVCPSCNHEIPTKDLQGQMRSSIKNSINNLINQIGNV